MDQARDRLFSDIEAASSAGHHDEALALTARALKANGKDLTLLVWRAQIALAADQPDIAREAAHRATISAPGSSEAFAQLGLAFLDLKKPTNAEGNFKTALQLDAGNANALRGYGTLRLKQRRLAEAESLLVRALRTSPNESRLYVVLGDVFFARANHAGAIEAYRRARDLDQLNTEARDKYEKIKQIVGGTDAARETLEDAVARKPDQPTAHLQLARFLADHGQLEDAVASAHRALALDPDSIGALETISRAKTFTSAVDPDIVTLEARLRSAVPQSEDRASLAFALGKAFDDLKDYRKAFDHYLEGNTIVRRGLRFDLERERRSFKATAAAFNAGLLARLRDSGNPSGAPIFVVGMPRSGTTLTETLLSRNRDVFPAGELEMLRAVATTIVGGDPTFEARRFTERLSTTHLASIGNGYLERLEAGARQSPRFTDKMPHNFQLLGLIRLALPNARIVHVRRDPLDNCLSLFKGRFKGEAQAFSYDLTELGRYHNLYRGLMRYWRTVLPGQFLEIDYEALVSDPEASSRTLFEYCGLDWTPDVLAVEKSDREVKTMSFAQVRQPINTASVRAADRYGAHLDPLRQALAEYQDDAS